MEKVNKGAHGYGAMFTFGLMDRYWKPDMNLEECKDIIRKCIAELFSGRSYEPGGYVRHQGQGLRHRSAQVHRQGRRQGRHAHCDLVSRRRGLAAEELRLALRA